MRDTANKPSAMLARLVRQCQYELETKDYTMSVLRTVGELRYIYDLGQTLKAAKEELAKRGELHLI